MKEHSLFQNNPWLQRKRRVTGFSPVDLGFVFGLIVPMMAIHFYLKWTRVSLYGEIDGILDMIEIFKFDLLFHFSYILLIFASLSFCKRVQTKILTSLLLEFVGVSVLLLEFCAHNYYMVTGSMLNYDLLEYTLENIGELRSVLLSTGSLFTALVFFIVFAAVVTCPWVVAYLIAVRKKTRNALPWFSFLPHKRWVGLGLGLATLILLFIPSLTGRNILFTRNLIFHLAQTYYENHFREGGASLDAWRQPRGATLEYHLAVRQKNLVLIILESTRSDATSLYNPDIKTTPFLEELGKKSLVMENAFAVVPHTSKSLVAIHCGTEPKVTTKIEEAEKNGIPLKCLPELLGEVGYRTAYFQTATEHFQNRRGLVANFGYAEFYPGNRLPKENYQPTNYFGYEDRILLGPSQRWHEKKLKTDPQKPFMVTYLTNITHHNYSLPSTHRYRWFHPNGYYNRYLNAVHYVDSFLADLIQQYKDLGLYHNTVFVFIGDHGEGFREHDIYGHSNIVYREGLQVPFMIHDPIRFKVGLRSHQISFQPDVLPTIVDLLDLRLVNSAHRGLSVFKEKKDRAIYASCWNQNVCVSRQDHHFKYIHFFKKKPDEFYDLRRDPLESENIDSKVSPEVISEWKTKTLNWYSNNQKFYKMYQVSELASKKKKNPL